MIWDLRFSEPETPNPKLVTVLPIKSKTAIVFIDCCELIIVNSLLADTIYRRAAKARRKFIFAIMIKASELRKGNLIQHQHGSFLEVRVITTPESIKSEQEIFSCVNGFSVHELEPVPITEERLEKLGFVGFDGPKFPYTENHQFNHTRYRKTTAQDELVLTEIESIYILEGTENCASYIHQLQNICFDKSGEELEIQKLLERESVYL